MTRTFFVEPVTGAVVNRVEERNQMLSYDGTSVPAFVGTVHYTDKQVSDMVKDVKFQATMLGGMGWTFPLIGTGARPGRDRRRHRASRRTPCNPGARARAGAGLGLRP